MSESLSQLYLSNPALAVALRRRAQGEQFAQQGMDTSPTSWAGALARLAQAYVGQRDIGRADEAIRGIADDQKRQIDEFNAGNGAFATPPQPAGTMPSAPPAPTVSGAPGDYTSRVFAAEGTGANPNSTATGHGQFINGTWMAFAQANPQLFPNMDPQQILAQRDNPEIARQATQWLADQNAPILKANGVEPTEGAKGLAHYLGAAPAAAVWKADPNTPIEAALGAAIPPETVQRYLAANPSLVGKTAGQVAARYRAWDGPQGAAAEVTPRPYQVATTDGAVPPPPTGAPAAAPQAGPPRASPLADVYLQQAMALQRRAQQAAASPVPQIKAQAPLLMQQAQLYATLAKEKPKLTAVAPNATLYDERGNVVARGVDTEPLSVVQNGVDEKGNPRWVYATRPAAVGKTAPTPGPLVTVDQRAENAEAAKAGELLAIRANKYVDEAGAAAAGLDRIRQLQALDAPTGLLAPAQEYIGAALEALGVKGTDAVKAATNLQMFKAFAAPVVLAEQQTQTGVQTEGDATRMSETIGKITDIQEAARFALRSKAAQYARTMERSSFFQQWRRDHKTYDGADEAWNKVITELPMTIKAADGLAFYNEARAQARDAGIDDADFNAAWQAKAAAQQKARRK